MKLRSIRTKTVLVAIGVAIVTSVVAFITALVYYERRLEGLPPDVREQVDRQVVVNTPDDFDGIAELLVATLVAAVLGASLGVALTRRHARVVSAVSSAARELRAGDLGARAATTRHRWPDEADRLADDFNHMAEQLDALERERRTTSATLAHELRTPVSVLRARLQAHLDGVIGSSDTETQLLLDQTLLLERLIEDLRTLSLHTAGRLELHRRPTDLAVLAQDVAASMQLLDARPIRVEATPGTPVDVDPERVRQALANLVVNAQRHTSADATIIVRVLGGGSSVTIEVEDSSAAVDVGDGRTRGSGLGLGVVTAVADAHAGSFTSRDTTGGRICTMTLLRSG